MESSFLTEKTINDFIFKLRFSVEILLQIDTLKSNKKLQVNYLNNVQLRNFRENCAGKLYLHLALPAHCSGKFTYALFRVHAFFSNLGNKVKSVLYLIFT